MEPSPLIIAAATVALATALLPRLQRRQMLDRLCAIAGIKRQHDRTLTFPPDDLPPMEEKRGTEVWVWEWSREAGRHVLTQKRPLTGQEQAFYGGKRSAGEGQP